MKRGHAFFAIIICLAIAGNAQNVSLGGTVTGNNAGINGARVSVKNNPHLIAYTDASGAFALSGSVPVINRKSIGNVVSLLSIKNGNLHFATVKSQPTARIDLFSLNSSILFSRQLRDLAPGTHSVPLAKTGQGVYVVRLNVGSESYLMKMVVGKGAVLMTQQVIQIQTASTVSLAKSAASGNFVDTLIVVAQNWNNALVGLPDYDEQVNVTLTASNPWKPSGALVHDKGMVKIMAKDYDFEMGQPDPGFGEDSLSKYEQPVHTVGFTYDFWMDTTEVTQMEYDSIMKSAYADYLTSMNWDIKYGKGDRYPTYYIYWDNAALYCNARSKKEGLDTVYSYTEINAPTGELCELFNVSSDLSKNGYRMPTDAEWEYACRGGTATDFFWGKNYDAYPALAADTAEVNEYEIWRPVSWDLGENVAGFGTHQVGTLKPNAYGLYDISGNVSEHCHDYWADAYNYGPAVDPAGPATGELHVIRGGNWGNSAVYLRSANRKFDAADYPFFFCGFRTVRPVR
jgi:formylglycine-generating enzyme required for sulfatase activity